MNFKTIFGLLQSFTAFQMARIYSDLPPPHSQFFSSLSLCNLPSSPLLSLGSLKIIIVIAQIKFKHFNGVSLLAS